MDTEGEPKPQGPGVTVPQVVRLIANSMTVSMELVGIMDDFGHPATVLFARGVGRQREKEVKLWAQALGIDYLFLATEVEVAHLANLRRKDPALADLVLQARREKLLSENRPKLG